MKLAMLLVDNQARLGWVGERWIVDLAALADRIWGEREEEYRLVLGMGLDTILRANGVALLRDAVSALDKAVSGLDYVHVRFPDLAYDRDAAPLLQPVLAPSKIIGIGLNYRDHCEEQGIEPPTRPTVFAKFPSSLLRPGGNIQWERALTQQVDYEAELAVVIGRVTRQVTAAEAYYYVFGYTAANDVSARDLQFGDKQWVRGKSLDTFCPLGPWIVTQDEIGDPMSLGIRGLVNGEVRQESNTSQMIFGVGELIEFLSQSFTLLPGDIILTGTPAGVGIFRKPPLLLQDGDRVTVEIEKIGALTNTCRER